MILFRDLHSKNSQHMRASQKSQILVYQEGNKEEHIEGALPRYMELTNIGITIQTTARNIPNI